VFAPEKKPEDIVFAPEKKPEDIVFAPEKKPEDIVFAPEKKPEEKIPENNDNKIIEIQTNDIDETSSLANFFEDMKQIVEDKGIKVDKKDNNANNVTLFEDAKEIG